MPSATTLAGAFLLTGLAAAGSPLATLEVCKEANPTVSACTVTAQHQTVSTCYPTSTACATDGKSSSCSTAYSYSSWAYVSTVIPCGWDGTTISSCTVTKTDQEVPCSATKTTITSIHTIPTSVVEGNVTKATTTYSSSYQTISKGWKAPYNKLGPLAIPGYDGCELCTDCSAKGDGSREQNFDVTECDSSDDKEPSCSNYPERRFSSKAAPGSSSPVSAVNSMKTSVSSAGTYTFTFTNTAPAATFSSNGQKVTVPPRPWFNYQTRSCGGPTNFDFTVTVTKTIFVHPPYSASTGSSKTAVDPTNAFRHWGDWTPAQTTAPASSDDGFYIPVNSGSGSKYSKNGNQFIGFPNGGDDAGLVSGRENAAKFHWDSEGNLMFGDRYVSTSTGAGYRVFELGHGRPRGPKFSVGKDGSFNLPGAGFCATDSTFFITYGGQPGGCKPVNCNVDGDKPSDATTSTPWAGAHWGDWATTASSTWTTLTSASPTYTSPSVTETGHPGETGGPKGPGGDDDDDTKGPSKTLDPSADLDYPEPTGDGKGRPIPRKRGGVLRKRSA